MDNHDSIILIDYGKCPPCSTLICVGVCPLGVLEASADGKPQIVDAVSCSRCEVCANLCPANAIIINPDETNKNTI